MRSTDARQWAAKAEARSMIERSMVARLLWANCLSRASRTPVGIWFENATSSIVWTSATNPIRNTSVPPKPIPNATAPSKSTRRSRVFKMRSSGITHSNAPVNRPPHSQIIGLSAWRWKKFISGKPAAAFNARLAVQARTPHQTIGQWDGLPRCQHQAAPAATRIMAVPVRKNNGEIRGVIEETHRVRQVRPRWPNAQTNRRHSLTGPVSYTHLRAHETD